jgi:hypothetical protein
MQCERCKQVVLIPEQEAKPFVAAKDYPDGSRDTWTIPCCEKCRVEIIAEGWYDFARPA